MKDFPFESFPTGWYQVGWSADLAAQEVRALQLFDEEVVLYRTESGVACLATAKCPHLGAHLGYGGHVVGECIACPFHGWEYGIDGTNRRIPYLEMSNPNVRLNQWHVAETDGFIIVWYDALGRPPSWTWRAPEFGDADNFYEPDRHSGGIRRVLPHQPIENGPDTLHFPFVHGAGEPAVIVDWRDDDHTLRVLFDLKFGAGQETSLLTPNGPAVARLDSVGNISLGIVRFTLEDLFVVQVVATTPVDRTRSMMFSTTTGRRDPASPGQPSGRTKFMMEIQHALVERDFNIWEHQTYVERPPYAGHEEKYFPRFRRWLTQFYPDAETVARKGPGDDRP